MNFIFSNPVTFSRELSSAKLVQKFSRIEIKYRQKFVVRTDSTLPLTCSKPSAVSTTVHVFLQSNAVLKTGRSLFQVAMAIFRYCLILSQLIITFTFRLRLLFDTFCSFVFHLSRIALVMKKEYFHH